MRNFTDTLAGRIDEMSKSQTEKLINFGERLNALTQSNEQKPDTVRDIVSIHSHSIQETNTKRLEGLRIVVDGGFKLNLDESSRKLDDMRTESGAWARQTREEMTNSLKGSNDSVLRTLTVISETQKKELETLTVQLARLTESNEQRLDMLRAAVEKKLKDLQEDNTKQLDLMRATVDEKLQSTLERRLGESFKQVSEQLEQVYKGLGEMQVLATGVGDLKKLLTNVKTRGTWGEVQLGTMLDEVLAPEQYAVNVATKNSGERVEFAIKLPGHGHDECDVVWLPIDAKFPIEDYHRLIEAQEKADAQLAEVAAKQLENRVKQSARDICEKYLSPPMTTDFAILFLPLEGLFAKVIRRRGLCDYVQREYKVVIAGPTTLWAILNSLQMGFRTLSVQKRSSEVWNLLSAVKTEWSKYGETLDKVQKKILEASETIEKAQVRRRAIGRKLKDVRDLPASEAQSLLMIESNIEHAEAEPAVA